MVWTIHEIIGSGKAKDPVGKCLVKANNKDTRITFLPCFKQSIHTPCAYVIFCTLVLLSTGNRYFYKRNTRYCVQTLSFGTAKKRLLNLEKNLRKRDIRRDS